jgi:hypothetical protein
MAAKLSSKQEQFVDKLIHSKTGFEPNAIIRGAQLTFVGSSCNESAQIQIANFDSSSRPSESVPVYL